MSSDFIPYLRLIHIFSATFWAGAAMFMVFFLYPTVKVSGDTGKNFLKSMVQTSNLPMWMSVSSLLAILSGLALFDIMSGGFSSAFFKTNYGITLAAGSTLAIVAFLHGFIKIRPCGNRMGAIGKGLAMGTISMSDEIMNEMKMLYEKIVKGANLSLWMILASLACMIVARYV